ncbi:hypothetical protein HMPREF3047_07650 [Neisseria sp. HMSC075C10]|uniref:hypothetical protein n=1 Tax=unclassified Neisseria TaxID=2623750 RepID=UPI0008A10587|nr:MULTISPECIES: hypothetical protein [unclassified Neisseria]OFO38229.1 hypothetical protein HMPREF3047_07650 [Neisseria sp. HMSC075C10]OHQ58675.1 hypothetical protein HMPREF2606_05250 [Neisseria sp. HMSC070H10]
MQRKIGIIIMLSVFSVSSMAGGEVQLGKSKAYDNEYELVAEHEVNEEGSQLNQDEYAAHPIRNDSGVMQSGKAASGRQAVSQYGKPNLPPVRLNPHPSRP